MNGGITAPLRLITHLQRHTVVMTNVIKLHNFKEQQKIEIHFFYLYVL